ncbi:acyltransferase family protein [Streptacidiphilus fuscans]|uniref:Acyltransferase n=1 Tax=Streptacidiphilus fuscans TaxID=2789292 RepID=A0A931FFE0_9ACTN|nr:acyltransferase [Streptacidiphilus fuscans]MBF9068329.1 acyltransferase [Streptacidiphilus fuscans]
MRLIAALAVAGYHYLGIKTPAQWGVSPLDFAYPLHHALMYGWLGVEAFFVISGFVICMSSWGRTPGQFAVSRISRLYPAYWCAIVLIVARIALIPMQTHNIASVIHPRIVLANLTMFPGSLHINLLDGVAWTLNVEAHFYLLMAAVLAFGTTYQRMMGFCAVWLVAGYVVQETHSTFLDDFVLSDYTGLFVAGMAVYLMYRFGQNLMLWTLLGSAWAYELVMLQDRLNGHPADWGTNVLCSWTVAAALLTGFLVLLMLATIGPLARVQWRWLVTAGALTYPFYLVHQAIGVPMGEELTLHVGWLGVWGRILVTVGSMLLLSYLIHRLVEKPLGRYLRQRLARALKAPTEVAR